MRFLRRGPDRAGVPAWAATLTPERHAAFEAALAAELDTRGARWTRQGEVLRFDPEGSEYGQLSLANIAQVCAHAEAAESAEIIRRHLDLVEASGGSRPARWPEVQALVRPRLLAVDRVTVDGLRTWPIADGVVGAIAIDRGDSVATPGRDREVDWPDGDESWQVALDNLRGDAVPEPRTMGQAGFRIHMLLQDDFFAASRVLLLPTGFPMDGAHDALVAVPTDHALLVHAMRHDAADLVVEPMVRIAADLYAQGPHALVPDVFWWHDGDLQRLTFPDRRGVRITYPPAFRERLARLPHIRGA